MAFVCHDQGANCLTFAQQHQLLISCGKKGEINLFDTRNHELIREFQAHDSSVRCVALDPHEEFFITGAADGDIKVRICVTTISKPFFNKFNKIT